MSKVSKRHTMGQDWGGRRPLNPPDACKVTRKQVEEFAYQHSIKIKREGRGMWFYYDAEKGGWYTAGMTNYIAIHALNKILRIKGGLDKS